MGLLSHGLHESRTQTGVHSTNGYRSSREPEKGQAKGTPTKMVTKKTGPVGLAKPRVVKLMPEVITLSPPREVRLTPPRVVRLSKPAEKLTPPSSGPSPRHKNRSDDRYRDAQQRGRTEQKHTPHRQDISGSESSAFSSKSLGSDLRLMINSLNKEYREQSQDTH